MVPLRIQREKPGDVWDWDRGLQVIHLQEVPAAGTLWSSLPVPEEELEEGEEGLPAEPALGWIVKGGQGQLSVRWEQHSLGIERRAGRVWPSRGVPLGQSRAC